MAEKGKQNKPIWLFIPVFVLLLLFSPDFTFAYSIPTGPVVELNHCQLEPLAGNTHYVLGRDINLEEEFANLENRNEWYSSSCFYSDKDNVYLDCQDRGFYGRAPQDLFATIDVWGNEFGLVNCNFNGVPGVYVDGVGSWIYENRFINGRRCAYNDFAITVDSSFARPWEKNYPPTSYIGANIVNNFRPQTVPGPGLVKVNVPPSLSGINVASFDANIFLNRVQGSPLGLGLSYPTNLEQRNPETNVIVRDNSFYISSTTWDSNDIDFACFIDRVSAGDSGEFGTFPVVYQCLAGQPMQNSLSCPAGTIFRNDECVPLGCGDSIVHNYGRGLALEECDMGAYNGGDYCTTDCGLWSRRCFSDFDCAEGWQCAEYPAPHNSDIIYSECRKSCQSDGDCTPGLVCRHGFCFSNCGNGIVDGYETCDDGNQVPNDGCSETCDFVEERYWCPNQGGPCRLLDEMNSQELPSDFPLFYCDPGSAPLHSPYCVGEDCECAASQELINGRCTSVLNEVKQALAAVTPATKPQVISEIARELKRFFLGIN